MTDSLHGAIGIGLYLHDLPANQAAIRLTADARVAESAGFDGATISEHHAGHRAYLPNPLLASNWILSETERLWAGPLEDLAWLDARFPSRVVAGLAPGYNEADFRAVGARGFGRRGAVFGASLNATARTLRGNGNKYLQRDPAIRDNKVRLLSAAGSETAAVRAAEAGVGLLLDAMSSDERLRIVTQQYASAGGTGPRLLSRRVWLGAPPMELFTAQLQGFQANADRHSWLREAGPGSLVSGSPAEIVEQIEGAIEAAGATALLLRVHLPGVAVPILEEQMRELGGEVLPGLRRSLSAHSALASQDASGVLVERRAAHA
jgi:alkanesulfonate monooxygenase SsuD/methylene tetrahydromethanopterin reductase-like flavin-dependent oxidoreductase (luciferase family)